MLHVYIVLFGYVYLDEEDMQKMVDVDLSMPLYTPKHTYKEMCVCKCGVCVCVCHLTELSHHNNQQVREDEKSWRSHKPRSKHDLSSCSVKV